MRQGCQPFMIFQEIVTTNLVRSVLEILQAWKKKMQGSLTTMQTLEDKHKRMYSTAKGGSASKREGKKKTETNKKQRRIEREKAVAVASSCSYGKDIVEPQLLSKDAKSNLEKRDV